MRPRYGHVVRSIPSGAASFVYGTTLYYAVDGIYYVARAANELAITEAPVGYIVHTLPLGFMTYYYNGQPYYYYAGTYYLWNASAGGFQVIVAPDAVQTMVARDFSESEPETEETVVVDAPVQAPEVAASVASVSSTDEGASSAEGNATPEETAEQSPVVVEAIGEAEAKAIAASAEGESKEDKDRRECGGWAVYESKFDPDKMAAEKASETQILQYNKTLNACLKSRGWAIVGGD